MFNLRKHAFGTGNGEYYTASNRILAIYRDKKLIDLYLLPAELYYKPEGIDFTEKGDLFISSEGMKKGYLDGQIFFFKMR